MIASPIRILLVEDSLSDAELMRERLEAMEALAVQITHVTTLRRAVDELRGPLPDAVVLDLNLPDSSGATTLQRLLQVCPDVPTVVLTGGLTPPMRDALLAAGATECLDKSPRPFEMMIQSIRFSVALRRAVGQQRQMERLVTASPDAVVVVDAAGRVRFVNDAALELFGVTRESFIGELLAFSAPPDKVTELAIRRRGEQRTAEMRSVTVEWEGHAATMVTLRDTTESRKLAEQLFQAQKMEAVGHLAGGIAHDFNNLITVMLAYGVAIKETLQRDDPRLEDLTQILAAADRAKSLTAQLLAFARRQPVQVQQIQVTDLAHGIRQLLERTIPEHITLEVRADTPAWPIVADRGQIEQVLINLAVNASDAMPTGGRILLLVDNVPQTQASEGWPGGPAVRIRVTDTGEGIAPDLLGRIFEPFFTTKAPGKGTGLGLATCYGIVRQAGGTITAQSRQGEGTTFTILLPPAKGEGPASASPPRPLPGKLEGSETVVVVEDDDSLRRSIVRVLRRYGYTVLTATNGEEGQRLIEGHDGPIDLIITDLIMPRMGGGELIDYLRRVRPWARVLCITGYAIRPGDPTTGLREGVEVLYKPFEPVELVQQIRQMVGNPG